jgi:hypothetical protein
MEIIKILPIISLLLLGNGCSHESEQEGWISLFNGRTLEGWTPNFDDQQVEVRDGMIQMLSVKKNLWLVHQKVFKDFELVADIKAPLENYNTGIAFRCDGTPIGYQCKIFDQQTGSLASRKVGYFLPAKKNWTASMP